MSTLKNTSTVVAVFASGLTLLTAVTAANAVQPTGQKAGVKEGAAGRAGRDMVNKLNLTAAQKARIKTMQADAMKQRKAIIDSKTLTPEQKKTQTRTLMMSMTGKFMAILTPEQMKTLQTNAGAMAKMQTKKGAAPVAPKP